MAWEFGVSRGKLSYIGWINKKILLHSTGNYIRHPVINHNGKTMEKNIGLARWLSGKESIKRHGFDPCFGKIPWQRK